MSYRLEKVNKLIKLELSQILLKETDFTTDILVTLTKVEAQANLKEANVFLSVMPDSRSQAVIEELNKKIYLLQQLLNKRLKMRPVPKIRFVREEKTVEAAKIEKILDSLKKQGK